MCSQYQMIIYEIELKMNIEPTEKYMIMGPNIRALVNTGLWPAGLKNFPLINKLHGVYGNFMLFIFLTFSLSSYMEVLFVLGDVFELMYNLSISLLYAIILAKISLVVLDRKKVSHLFDMTHEFQEYNLSHSNKKNGEIFVKYCKITNFYSRSFWLMVFITVNMLVLPGFLAVLGFETTAKDGTIAKKALPFSCYLPFDQQMYHTWAYITQCLLCIPGTSYIAVWDTFLYSLMMSGICQLNVLENSLITLGEYGTDSVFDTVKDCIRMHQKIIKYITDLDSLVSTVLFFDFLVYAILLCSISVRVMFDDRIGLPQYFAYFVYLGSILVQLFMFYWTGNELMLGSMEIAMAVWKSKWYNFDKSVKKMLVLIMMRSIKPLKISVGRFYDMNLESLVIILRAWYSYLTLLNQTFNMKE